LLITFIVIILLVPGSRSLAGAQTGPDPKESSPVAQGNTPQSQKALQKYQQAQADPNLSDEEKIKAAIDAYFTTRYEGQAVLARIDISTYSDYARRVEQVAAAAEQDFSLLVEAANADWLIKEKDLREIELYKAVIFDLGYKSYNFTIDYDSMEINGDNATVQLREGYDVVFNVIAPEVSSLANLKHTLALHRKKAGWLISNDESQSELSRRLEIVSKDEVIRQINENYQTSVENQKKYDSTKNMTLQAQPVSTASLTSYPYYRAEAVRYADGHVPHNSTCEICGYNVQYYKTETANGDCTNYVSQAIYAGGGYARPDLNRKGMNATWFYDAISKTGSPAWVGVVAQRDAFVDNTSMAGPYGYEPVDSLCNVSAGDVVQIIDHSSDYDHEGIIVARTQPGCALSSLFLNAHNNDRYHVPLSDWAAHPMRFITISGYRSDDAPAFSDVPPTHWAWDDVEKLYVEGITAGCGSGIYCPERQVTRAEMAVFLLRAKYGPFYVPPAVGYSTGFDDVPVDHWAAAWIKQLHAEGITAGCSSTSYCPQASATHAQMAVFLLRVKYGIGYTPPAVWYIDFYDVSNFHWAVNWIQQVAAEGISYGAHNCSVAYNFGRFCPENPVTRAEMAGMLLRARP
jgi:hypothetical protein